MGLEFSAEQTQVASIFTAYRNDIDIYTEDENKDKVFYKRLFSRLLEGSGVLINDVYPLGSSKDVIKACNNDTDNTRKKIYIVDGDIYLMYAPKPSSNKLFVLDAYCMGNMVIDEDSICNTLYNLLGELELSDIKTIYKFNELIDSHKDELIELFYYKALQNKYCGYFNIYSLSRYYNKKNELDLSEIHKEELEIKSFLIEENFIDEFTFNNEIELLRLHFPKTPETFLKIISGKDYLIHMIACHAAKVLKYKTGHSKYAWKFNFAQYCNLNRLQPLKRAIILAAK